MRRRELASAVAVWALSGCGYRFTAGSAPLPQGVRKVRVAAIRNLTAEPGLEVLFTQALRERMARAGVLVDAELDAEANITGEVLSISAVEGMPGGTLNIPSVNGSPSTTPAGLISYVLIGTLALRLVRGERVLSEGRMSGEEHYLATKGDAQNTANMTQMDPLRIEASRTAALRRLVDTLVREGVDRLANAF